MDKYQYQAMGNYGWKKKGDVKDVYEFIDKF